MLSLQEENPDVGVVQEESIASVALVSDEGQTNERELLLKTLLSEKASEASLKRTFTAAGKERDDAFTEFRKAQYKHSVLHSKHKQIQSELEKKSITVKLIQDAYSKVVGTNSKCCGEGEVVKIGEEVVPHTRYTRYEMKETVDKDLEFADTAECTDKELLDLLRETEKNLSKDGVAAVGGQTTSATKEKQNEEHTGKKNGPIEQANEKPSSEAVALPADASPAKKKRLIVQENEKHSSRKEKENQSSEGASLPAVVSPPRNPPKKKNVSV